MCVQLGKDRAGALLLTLLRVYGTLELPHNWEYPEGMRVLPPAAEWPWRTVWETEK